jgi:APA family basic amino acid/polyamine antiporter
VDTPRLKRELGLLDAVLLGLGSIIGTGVFVSIALAAEAAGVLVLPAIVLAAAVASLNGLGSAQLAARYPVSGGTYEYGYRLLNPWLGFSAGWMFLCAKTASAATAALGSAAYVAQLVRREDNDALHLLTGGAVHLLAVTIVAVLTVVVLVGVRTSSRVNALLVSVTLLGLLVFIAVALNSSFEGGGFFIPLSPLPEQPLAALLQATALMFVAFTGYARIATLGEEVHAPRVTIPRAIVITLWVAALLYLSVGAAALAAVDAESLAVLGSRSGAAALAELLQVLNEPLAARVVSIGALTAMLGVLLNLLLGLSRVLLAMGRRGDMPRALGNVTRGGKANALAVVLPGIAIALLAAFSGIKAAWSFSAFSVLVYYAITNLAALQLKRAERMYARAVPLAGLVACLSLAAFIEWRVMLWGVGLLGVGLVWHAVARRFESSASSAL